MLIKRKKGWQNNTGPTIDSFVDNVSEMHDAQPKPAKVEAELKREVEIKPQEPSKLFSGMKACNLGQSPEVLPRELLNK